MGKQISLNADERKRILWMFSDSIPQMVRFSARPTGGTALAGKVEVVRQGRSEIHALGSENAFPKGFWDFNYKIFVTPEQDCEIEFQSRNFGAGMLFIILAVLLITGIASGLTAALAQ